MAIEVTANSVLDLGYYFTSWDNRQFMFDFLNQAGGFDEGFSISVHLASTMRRGEEEFITHSRARVFIYRHTMGEISTILNPLLTTLQEEQSTNIVGSGGTFAEIIGLFVNIVLVQFNPDVDEQAVVMYPDEEEPEPDNDFEDLRKGLISTFLGCLATCMVDLPPERVRLTRMDIVNFYNQRYPALNKYLYKTHQFPIGDFPRMFNHINFPNQVIVHDDKGYCIATNGPQNGLTIYIYRNKTGRYYQIRNLRRFLRVRSHNVNQQYCRNCFKFHTIRHCPRVPTTSLPDEDFKYNRYTSRFASKSVGVADFESYIDPENKRHHLASYAFVGIFQTVLTKISTVDSHPNLIKHFMDYLRNEIYKVQLHAVLDREDRVCGVCGSDLYTDFYRLAYNYKKNKKSLVHTRCRKSRANSYTIYFHNLKGYDVNFLLRDILDTDEWHCRIFAKQLNQVLYIFCQNKERPEIRIQFKDSVDLFYCSIENLAGTITNWRFTPQKYIRAFDVSKGIFPYDWFDSVAKFREVELPIEDEHWFNKLKNKQEDKDLAFRAWEILECETFKDFVKHYNIMDCYILFEAIMELQRITHNSYNIDITDYLGIPSITWKLAIDACPETIVPIYNKDIYDELQQAIRGGVAQVMHRYADMEQFSHIVALDVNALYSSCMVERLPYEFVEKLETLDMETITESDWQTSEFIYFLNVDLEYPVELHDVAPHNQYPLAPHRYINRLCTTLFDKKFYLTSAENLQFYLKHGLRLTRIHFVYKFKQNFLFKTYVEGNIRKRNLCRNKIEKNNFKLYNNSLYGKTCENVFKYTDIQLLGDEDNDDNGLVNPLIANATSHLSISNDFTLATFQNNDLTINKPIYIGVAILEKAKLYVYRMIYEHLFTKFLPRDVQLCYTDTDSLVIGFRNQPIDPLIQMKNTNCPVDLNFNRIGAELPPSKTLGLWSNDLADYNFLRIREAVFLKAKLYCIVLEDGTEKGRTKGIKHEAVCSDTGERLTVADFKRSVKLHHDVYVEQYLFKKHRYEVTTIQQKKLALNCDDQKRLTIGYLSLPLGYKGEFYRELLHLIE